ncbi:MAG: hypothetical protein ACKOWG_03500 [Planctomycetia bacterium]
MISQSRPPFTQAMTPRGGETAASRHEEPEASRLVEGGGCPSRHDHARGGSTTWSAERWSPRPAGVGEWVAKVASVVF